MYCAVFYLYSMKYLPETREKQNREWKNVRNELGFVSWPFAWDDIYVPMLEDMVKVRLCSCNKPEPAIFSGQSKSIKRIKNASFDVLCWLH